MNSLGLVLSYGLDLMKKEHKTKKPKLRGRARRIDRAPHWLEVHRGSPKNMLRRYRKYFVVDWECAIAELEALGVEFKDQYLSSLRQTISRQISEEKKHTPIPEWEFNSYHGIDLKYYDSDEYLAYIAGYTSGGAPYGLTWEEMEEIDWEEIDQSSRKVPSVSLEKTSLIRCF